jgi:hypothetical protein
MATAERRTEPTPRLALSQARFHQRKSDYQQPQKSRERQAPSDGVSHRKQLTLLVGL